eukprot:TRINITY_DN203_c0_g1_i2.p1 TRINITY_DN203_c0_g1~~TRINITY_DN203_c0_g1_i2.p1  ORF type:complete len:240 (-),score=61.76 TRINITY_DN203_c0_g1_i2:76-795(-)
MAVSKLLSTLVVCALIVPFVFPFAPDRFSVVPDDSAGATICPACVTLFDDSLDILLNAILNGGVIGGCSELCGHINDKSEALTCDVLCSFVGIKEFVKIIESTDPDPIYICQVMKVCPAVNGGKVNITSATVSPASGPQGSEFAITMQYTVLNQTSTGLLMVEIKPTNGEPIDDAVLSEGLAPGKYDITFRLKTTPTEDEPFLPGLYNVEVAVCAGDCSTKHPYGGIYATASTSFNITR